MSEEGSLRDSSALRCSIASESRYCSRKDAVEVQAVWSTTELSMSASTDHAAATSFGITCDQFGFTLQLITTEALYAMINVMIEKP